MTCERCGQVMQACTCARGVDGQLHAAKSQAVRVSRERRGGGKMVTIVRGLGLRSADLSAMLKQLKSSLGAGGAVKEDNIELQGDHRDKLVEMFREMGYPAKASGG